MEEGGEMVVVAVALVSSGRLFRRGNILVPQSATGSQTRPSGQPKYMIVKPPYVGFEQTPQQYGADSKKIIVAGSSAGGHLVAMLGTSGDVQELEGNLGNHVDKSSRVDGVVNFFGPSDLASMGGWHNNSDSTRITPAWRNSFQRTRKLHKRRHLLHMPQKDDPPFLTIHGTIDSVVPFEQSVQLTKALQKAGAFAQLIPIEGGGHGRPRLRVLDDRIQLFLENLVNGTNHKISTEAIPSPKRSR